MRQSITILLLLASINAIAGHRYVSSSLGNDANTGLDSNHAYKSLTKVNAVYPILAAGDTIFFKAGDTFLGQLLGGRSGLAGLPMVLMSYGAGPKPIISGLIPLHNWTNVSGNIWQCTPDSVLKANTNVFTINGIPQAVGRTDWLHYTSPSTTQFTSSTTLSTSYVGAEVVIRKSVFVAEKVRVTAQSGNVITYSNAGMQAIQNGVNAGSQSGRSGYGFFFQRFAGSLDQQGEWFFDKSANKVKIYSTTNPNSATIKISFEDTLLLLGPRGYTTIKNIAFEGAGVYAIESYGGTNITIQNCDFNNNTKGVYVWNTDDIKVEYNNFENSFNGAIVVSDNQRKRIDVNYNYIHNTGQLIGMGIYNNENSLRGILARTSEDGSNNFVNIIGNKIIKTGNGSMNFQGSNVTVRRNVCDSFANVTDDMGGIYTFINNQSTNNTFYTNRIIDSNFVSNAIGAPLGKTTSGGIDVAGIYMDDQTCNVIIRYNTVWNIPGNGIQLNNPLNITVQYNKIYNCDFTVNENRKNFGAISGILISNNILYQKAANQRPFYTVTNSLTQPSTLTATQANQQLGTIDSNYINDIFTGGNGHRSIIAGTTSNFNLATWKSTYGHEIHSTLPPITTTTTNTRLVTNASDTVLNSGFIGQRKRSPKNVTYDNYISLPKWSSEILIDNGTANIPPVSNAGADLTTVIPKDSVQAVGSGSDADGTISTYAWSKVSGPSTYFIVTPSASTTRIRSLVVGVYKFSLTVTDNGGVMSSDTMQVTVTGNASPIANANADQTVTLPVNYTALTGAGSSDPDGSISSYAWTRISGPNTPTLGTANSISTGVTGMIQGVYKFKLTVTDNGGATGVDTVQVTVNPAVNILPVSNAGSDASITLPTNSATLSGSGSDADGTISSYLWEQLTGPNTAVIGTPATASTTVGSLIQGIYKFRLSVTDNSGGVGKDTMQLIVNAAINMTPLVSADTNRTIVLPITTTILHGSASDPDGSITNYAWTKISGPTGGTIATPSTAITAINSLQQGVYVFRLTVTDNSSATSSADVQITVNPNPAPVANAGSDLTVQLPTTTATLSGSGTDDISISSYSWAKLTGSPAGGTISNSAIASPGLSALQAGVYKYELTVTDNGGATGKDTVLVTVNLADNLLPHASAGIDRTITPPVDTLTIFGSGTDTDGTISTYSWTKILGPAAVIESPNSATTVISSLISGTYQFELTVTDDRGGQAKDTMQLVVNTQPFNIPPTADAGPDRSITAPQDTITLFGRGADVDGTITYYWSGNGGTILNRTTATPTITGLTPGTYMFALTVRDDGNLTATSTMTLIVYPAPRQKKILLGITVKKP